jgi:hypothetical protein
LARFTDDALARAFEEMVRIVEFDDEYWVKFSGGEWKSMPHSSDPKLRYLGVIREFCREQQDLIPENTELTPAQIERVRYRLGQLSTFRAIHKLIRVDDEATGEEKRELRDVVLRADARHWFSEPAEKTDFQVEDGKLDRGVTFKEKETRFRIRETEHCAKDWSRSYGPPYVARYGGVFVLGNFLSLEEAVDAIASYVLRRLCSSGGEGNVVKLERKERLGVT